MSQAIPVVTKQDVLDAIKSVKYFHDGLLTVAIVTTTSGVKHTGESACASELKYNKELDEQYALDMATNKVWHHLGILLKEKLALLTTAKEPSGTINSLGSPVSYLTRPLVVHAIPMTWGDYCKATGTDPALGPEEEKNGYVSSIENDPEVTWRPTGYFESLVDVGVRQ